MLPLVPPPERNFARYFIATAGGGLVPKLGDAEVKVLQSIGFSQTK